MGQEALKCEQPYPHYERNWPTVELVSEAKMEKKTVVELLSWLQASLTWQAPASIWVCCLCAQTRSASRSIGNKRSLPKSEVLGTRSVQSFFENLVVWAWCHIAGLRGQGLLHRKRMGGGTMTTRNTSSSDSFSEDKRCPREENSSNMSQSFATIVNFGYFAFILLPFFL